MNISSLGLFCIERKHLLRSTAPTMDAGNTLGNNPTRPTPTQTHPRRGSQKKKTRWIVGWVLVLSPPRPSPTGFVLLSLLAGPFVAFAPYGPILPLLGLWAMFHVLIFNGSETHSRQKIINKQKEPKTSQGSKSIRTCGQGLPSQSKALVYLILWASILGL